MSLRTPLIAGNWKMNKTATEGVELAKAVAAAVGIESAVQVVLCPPFTALSGAVAAVEGTHLSVGAQNMHDKANGAFTGEVSAAMLRDLHVSYVILGHSERRSLFGEDDAFINRKVNAALAASLKPILCVGELPSEREDGTTNAVVKRQIELGLAGVPAAKAEQVVIAYEPVWAIGTGVTASPEQAQETHKVRYLDARTCPACYPRPVLLLPLPRFWHAPICLVPGAPKKAPCSPAPAPKQILPTP
jgi:triosephosphate isomerase